MLICPNCQHKNMDGSIFCDDCGSQLQAPAQTTRAINPTKSKIGSAPVNQPLPIAYANSWGSLHLMDGGQIMPLDNRNEFTLGRVSEGQPVMPDVDLSPYQAYAGGVSRLHAMIRRDGQRVVIMDLGSANGTFVNGKRLMPNVERLLTHGDVIALGKLKFQILIK